MFSTSLICEFWIMNILYCETSWVPAWSDYPDKNRFFKSWLAEWSGRGEHDHWVEKWYLLFIMVMKVELTQEAPVDSVVLWSVICFNRASGFQSLACISSISTGKGPTPDFLIQRVLCGSGDADVTRRTPDLSWEQSISFLWCWSMKEIYQCS